MTLPIIVPGTFRIIAHRGASAYAPENTRAAFKLAANMNVQEFELDIQLSHDEEIVICHDETLERYGYENRIVENMRWEELSQLDMGSWFSPFLFAGEKMMTLPELFHEYQDTVIYHIEIKGKAKKLPLLLCQTISECNLQSNCILTSFSYDALLSARSVIPDIRVGWLIDTIDEATLLKAKESEFSQLCPHANLLTKETVMACRSGASEVRAWGLNGQRDDVLPLIRQVINADCDGMTINWPDWVRHQRR
ncbi:MAG: hypothetical protein GY801_05895 [bacterium]|nr:hypothetical protein [bacterium]